MSCFVRPQTNVIMFKHHFSKDHIQKLGLETENRLVWSNEDCLAHYESAPVT